MWGYDYFYYYYSEISLIMNFNTIMQVSSDYSLSFYGYSYVYAYGGYFAATSGVTGFQVNPDFVSYGSNAWWTYEDQYMGSTGSWMTVYNYWTTSKSGYSFAPNYGSLIDSTGTFTAPASGLYVISANAWFLYTSGEQRMIASINGDTSYSPCMWFDSSYWYYEKSAWCQGVAYLHAGTKVQLQFYSSSTQFGYWYLYYTNLAVQMLQLDPGH